MTDTPKPPTQDEEPAEGSRETVEQAEVEEHPEAQSDG
jgi:hypothetical protein